MAFIKSRDLRDHCVTANKLAAGIPGSNDFGTGGLKADLIVTSSAASGSFKIGLSDNLASALNITEGANSYLKFVTSNGTEDIVATKHITASAGITGNVTGNVTGSSGSCTGASATCTGNAGSATTAAACSGLSATATKLAASGSMFQSAEITNASAAVATAHGLTTTPSMFWISLSDIPVGAFTITLAADATNITATASGNCKYYVYGLK